ncbi:PREDICTED: LOW QUALITY PROTEIN: uncharacterized protein LOC104814869 [Tarenaya hassleriana]|uniref:LOW QUALITY PROTEIN: uncharacterized protein LOC104814869 n=1 Tax=Tarenaya hassleriana TaxID=28532 RepID=UPI00053C961F|nr:PREDICTED: LOW QUALITY PROTEIN: uncharacterized protein LOC104814869 [Tarenaya hassleriana]
MDELFSTPWLHLESFEEMRLVLHNTLLGLEALRIQANEQARIHQEEVTHLLDLVKLAQQERDEAKQHLAHLLIRNPKPSITDSNSFSQSSSPSSPELSSFVNQYQPLILEDPAARIDPLDDLVEGKTLPETGKLLKAVVEAGPLLETLIVAGTLPQWTNPPPPLQPQRFAVPSELDASCSASVSRIGFGLVPVIDNRMLTGKRQRLE